jgi:hypothetical protein
MHERQGSVSSEAVRHEQNTEEENNEFVVFKRNIDGSTGEQGGCEALLRSPLSILGFWTYEYI